MASVNSDEEALAVFVSRFRKFPRNAQARATREGPIYVVKPTANAKLYGRAVLAWITPADGHITKQGGMGQLERKLQQTFD